jgi:hypothetical protein
MTKPDPTTSELAASLKELDFRILHQFDIFATDTGVDIIELHVTWDEEKEEFLMDYRLAFPEE